MAENVLKIPLAELATVRVVCLSQNCNGAVEMPSARLTALVGGPIHCPSCNQPFAIPNLANIGGLRALGMAMQNLGGPGAIGGAAQPTYRVEFVIPGPDNE
jgi:hypothetical protein